MLTAGETLLQARLRSKLTFTQITKLTHIPVNTLKALEKNQYSKLPGPTYIKGFIQNYAQVLGLEAQSLLAMFRRDYDKHTTKKILPEGLVNPLNQSLPISSKRKPLLTFIAGGLILLAYLGLVFFKLNQPPSLNLTQPKTGDTLQNPVLIKGKTSRDAALTLNGKIVNLEPDGSFTTVFNGLPGAHELKLIATSRRQKSKAISTHIIIEP